MTNARILAIDDEAMVLYVIGRVLEKEGFQVLTATDGERGLEIIRTEHPDLVISDISMPKIDGLQLIQMMRKDPLVGSTPFILLSGKGTVADQIRGLELGADDYIAKPFSTDILLVRVKAMLRRVELLKKRTSVTSQGPFADDGMQQFATYTFESFVIGDENRMAYEAAKDVSERPGARFNPLFIYGEPGRGKTHLMCAVANEAYEKDNSIKALYLTSQVFSDQILGAYEHRRVDQLKESYLESDILFIDDIQFLAISPSLQEVTADILSEMYNEDKQVMISSDRRPEEMRAMTMEMSRRFGDGLVVEIGPPAAAMRSTILRKKAKEKGWPIPDFLLDRIAHRVKSDVRTLEGIAKKLIAMATLEGVSIDEEVVDEVMRQVSVIGVTSTPAPRRPLAQADTRTVVDAGGTSRAGKKTVAGSDHLVKESSRELQVVKVWGPPEKVGPEISQVGSQPVVVLSTSGALAIDVVNALSGIEGQKYVFPREDQWAYMVHRDCIRPEWIIIGTNQWNDEGVLAQANRGNKEPVFIVLLDGPTPKILEGRDLLNSIPSDRKQIVVFVAGIVDYYQDKEADELLSTSMRKLFRVPESIPFVLSFSVKGEDCREWLRMALDYVPR